MKIKKHYIWFILILVMTVGCKSKNLSCTKMIMDTDSVKVEERITLNFKDNELSNSFFSLNYYYADDIESNSQSTQDTLTEQFSIYDGSKGIEYFFSDMEKGIHFELQTTQNKLTDEEKTNLEHLTNYKNYSEAKESLVEEGYQCK